MALAERAELVARLSLKDDFSGRLKGATGALRGMEGSLGRIAGHAKKGLGAAATNLAKIGVVATGFAALQVRSGIQSLAELEDATTSVDGAIAQMGKGWSITGQTIATWANEIEASTQAAFDDKEITAAASALIRYGKVSEDNLRPALVVMTDLAAKTGSVDAASSLLAKALAAPEKAAGKLARVGVILTKQQQKQISAMVEAGDVAGAQTVLLDALAESTKGAAAASAGPYRDAMNILKDVTEDAQRALGEAFLPVLSKVADKLSKWLAGEGNMQRIRDFGKDLAGGFDKLLTIVGNIPWAQVGDSMKIAGAGAKALFDAFTSLPPWVQTAVLTGWGLNKLTGGALGGIVGELGKGLIKGVLGINAGVVNARAGVVNVAGGVPGGGGAPGAVPVGAKPGGLSALGKVFLVGEAIGLVLAVKGVADSITASGVAQAQGIGETLKESLASPQTAAQLQIKLDAINTGIAKLKADPVAAALITGPVIAELEQQRQAVLNAQSDAALNAHRVGERVSLVGQKVTTTSAAEQNAFARLRERTEASRIAIVSATQNSKSAIVSSGHSDRNAIVSAIARNRPIVTVQNYVSVSPSSTRVVNYYNSGGSVHRVGGPQEYD